MERLAVLQARIASIVGLTEVVSAMRSLAAIRMQQAGEALAGTRAFADAVTSALAGALALGRPPDEPAPRLGALAGPPAGLLVFCGEHGFVGGLNEVLLARAQAAAAGAAVLMIGSRGLSLAAERGLPVAWSLAMTSHRDGVVTVARRIADELTRRYAAREMGRLEMMFARAGEGGRWTIETRSLLPLDWARLAPPPGAQPPLTDLAPALLIERLAEEYLFAELTRGAMEALAGENAARFAATSAARENIDRKLEDLRAEEHHLRQEEITTELLDLVAGSEVLLRG